YCAITLQKARGLDAMNPPIPTVGDDRYQDIQVEPNSLPIDYGLEASSPTDTYGKSDQGEDNEISVSRILYDLADQPRANKPDDDPIKLGSATVWSILVSAKPKTLSDAWKAFTKDPNMGLEEKLRYAKVFADQKVAPEPLVPLEGTSTSAITDFVWDA